MADDTMTSDQRMRAVAVEIAVQRIDDELRLSDLLELADGVYDYIKNGRSDADKDGWVEEPTDLDD